MWACFYVYALQLANFLIIRHGQQINSVIDVDESKKWSNLLLFRFNYIGCNLKCH